MVNVVIDEDDGMLRSSNDVAEKGIGIEDLVFEEDAVFGYAIIFGVFINMESIFKS